MKKLELTPLTDIPLIQAGDDLAKITLDALSRQNINLFDGDVLVFAQKIVSKAENRLVYLPEVQPSEQAVQIAAEVEKDPRFVELVLRESNQVLRKRAGTIIVEHRKGFICANAGIDHSNVRGPYGDPDLWVLLLPEDPDRSAQYIRSEIEQQTDVKIGVLIIDSHGRAWRLGTVGVAIGLAGMPGLVDLRGEADMFGYQLRITQVAVADELAAAASLVMGQADERTPIVHVRGFPYPLREGSFEELPRPVGMDLFR